MAKPSKSKAPVRRHTKKKAAKRVQNAFEIALAEERGARGSDSEDSDDGIVNARKFSVNGEGGDGDFLDEELDSDEAMGSDDEFDVLNSKFSQTLRDKADRERRRKKALKKGEEVSSAEEEDSDGEKSVDEGDFVSLSEVWDLDDKDITKTGDKSDVVLDDEWESESEDDSQSESEADDESEEDVFPDSEGSDAPSDDDDEIDLKILKSALSGPIKKDKKHYTSSTVPENELALPGGGAGITLSDMLSVVDPTSSQSAILINRDLEEDKNQAVPVPLPKRIQERNERKAAYGISKEEVDKWQEQVAELKRADVLQFPLPQPDAEPKKEASTYDETKPINDFESRINSILTESKLVDEEAESKFEEIATAKLSKAELQKRQGELRKMRELMFRQEREAKRIKKIKSKSYRRIKKKELMKNKQLVEDNDEEFAGIGDDDEQEQRRAEQRMQLKHKTNSKWAQSMIRSGLSKDAANREELESMLQQGERLKAKILDREEGDLDEFNDMRDMNIDREIAESDEEERAEVGKTGVMNMAFMRNAEAREKTANEEYKHKLRQLERDDDIAEFEQEHVESGVSVTLGGGRRIYSPGSALASREMESIKEAVLEEDSVDQSTSLANQMNRKTNKKPLQSANIEINKSQEQGEDSNPWLAGPDTIKKSNKVKIVDSSSSKLEKSAAKINKKQQAKTGATSSNSADDADALINMNETLAITDPHAQDSDNDDDDKANILMFKQTDLIAQAFAGDDVVADFETEKRQVERDEGDHVEDITLPGWGDWAGGSNKRRKTNKKKIVKVTKGIDVDARKDKKLKNVIINEKTLKKNAKYQSSAVPFPFESREQYERSLRMPIGQEWTSRESHQKLTMPKVIAKRGVVIDPMKKK